MKRRCRLRGALGVALLLAASSARADAPACVRCHADVAAQWRASAHRHSSFNNPYYAMSINEFRAERGAPASRFCARCHDPALIKDGTIDAVVDENAAAAQAGIECLVCHSIDVAPLTGNGEYHLTDIAVSGEMAVHKARLRPALLGTSALCQSCHKVALTEALTGDRWLRGQDDYDPWLASAAAGHGAGAIPRPERRARCQDCHMPLEPVRLGDAAAKNGMIRSHRFVGANTALPFLRGDTDMLARTTELLRGSASVDLVWAANGALDVVLRSRGVGHRFPGGTVDSNEVWLEVEARDAADRVVARSGDLDRDGTLDAGAHLVRAQPVDGEGRPLLRRDPQHMRGVAYDTSLSPADPQVVRYLVPPPAQTVRVRLLYRKFSAAYARAACATVRDVETRRRCLAPPVTEIARAELRAGAAPAADWQRALDHGLALADAVVERAEEALPSLLRARTLAPERPEPELGLARLALALGRTDEAVAATVRAERKQPNLPAALLLRATALYRAYRFAAARAPAETLVSLVPEDRAALVLIAKIRGVDGDAPGALGAADELLRLDPEDPEAHYQRALALAALGRDDEAHAAEARYVRHRSALETNLLLREKFRAREPRRADEAIPVHTHRLR
ncbi:MAG: hypothetical protein JWN44_3755 [Myxococcales bacterium]|nr:hypothetical protein [Myxococcales bacterium]